MTKISLRLILSGMVVTLVFTSVFFAFPMESVAQEKSRCN